MARQWWCSVGVASCARLLVAAVFVGSVAGPAHAKSGYLSAFRTQYPAAAGSRIDVCGLCHTNVPQRNAYGSAFRDAGRKFPPIEALDSDGDGATNLREIQAFTFPGDSADTPPALASPTPTATPPPATPTATPGMGACVGDCNADRVVTVNELLLAVNIALGTASIDSCSAVDRNGDGAVTITDLLVAVNMALNDCPTTG